ncbi:putative glutamate decarboxylase 5-like [Capsicum annuum]|nr:putative glutamate decarboxylase 5-like [Capsicum annuum]
MSGVLRKKVQRKFKMRGYSLKVEALSEVLSFLSHFPSDSSDDALELLLDELHHLSLKSSILDRESVHKVVSILLEADAAVEENPSSSGSSTSALRVIDAFIVPKFRYDPVKKFFHEYTGRLPIHGDASAKATLYKDRFLLLFQRLCRDPRFSTLAFDASTSDYGNCEVSGNQNPSSDSHLSRWIAQLWLSSSSANDAYSTKWLFADIPHSISCWTGREKMDNGSNISVGGWSFLLGRPYCSCRSLELDKVFAKRSLNIKRQSQFSCLLVRTCGFPPLEDREKSMAFFAGLDFFGGGILTKEETLRLVELEKNAVNDMFVILSDIWLDNEELGQMIASHQRVKEHSRFLFIPGPDDVGPSTALPRCSLPKYVSEELQKYVPNAIFSSNPCRIKFYTQEIVLFRQDMLYRMRRSCLIPPSTEETSDPFEHLVATIIHQSHLCPLPLTVQPIIWNYDHGLHLYPTPHTIVLGDKSEQKAFRYTGVTCFNPGSFSNDGTFVAYRPCNQEVELSAL